MKCSVLLAAGIAAVTVSLPLMLGSKALANAPLISQIPGEEEYYEETVGIPEDYYSRGQQIGQSASIQGESYDPISVCNHLSTEYAQQCIAGYHDGYGTDLSSEEVSSYYYSQGYQQGTLDAQAGKSYDPADGGYHNLPEKSDRQEWSDGYHEGYWEHFETQNPS